MDDTVQVGQSVEPVIDNLTRDAVAEILGLKNFGEIKRYQDHIKRLIDWAQVKGAKDRTDVLWAIEKLADRVGSPKIGNNWAQHLSQYAYLEMERLKIDQQLEEMKAKLPEVKEEVKEDDSNIPEKTNTA